MDGKVNNMERCLEGGSGEEHPKHLGFIHNENTKKVNGVAK
jgi:hypothetical protein